jgi:hypothetical protein
LHSTHLAGLLSPLFPVRRLHLRAHAGCTSI